ncbi:hypothetical protein [Bosea rubneri]|uniref:Uncharacterized protein n=1 Tax=Bosea rubneri TaxID=3075434 RepID=A0ABU3S4Z3_9HYPH|nr:hypothetical protein [Bosea sp. ZW T0_25]MDU0339848.1 hypothetical protein [Bosea sp. ZW T0_25]
MTERAAKNDHRSRKAADVQLFTKSVGRKKRGGSLDPNDRKIDQRVAKAVERMRPEEFDAMLRDGEDQ